MRIDDFALSLAQGNKEQAEIVSYVLKSRMHSWGTLLITFIVSYFLNILPYALIITYSIILLRVNSGGCHSKSLKLCSIVSFLIINGLALLVNHINFSQVVILCYSILIYIFGMYLIFKYVPLDSPQRPIVNIDFRKKLKIRSYIIINSIIVCFYILYLLNYQTWGISILLGLTWQIFTMSKLGYWVIGKIDYLT